MAAFNVGARCFGHSLGYHSEEYYSLIRVVRGFYSCFVEERVE